MMWSVWREVASAGVGCSVPPLEVGGARAWF